MYRKAIHSPRYPNPHQGKAALVNSSINGVQLKPLALLFGLLMFQSFTATANNQFEFDDSMLVGSAKEQKSIARFNQANAIEPGTYQVDIFVNGDFFTRKSLQFSAGDQGHVSACLSQEMLLDAGILPSAIKNKAENVPDCLSLEQQVDGASSRFDFARLRLDLSVPQLLMRREARGAVPVKDLSAGETVAFTSYDTNYYRTRASGYTTDSTYLGLNSGFNLGLWQFRQQSSYTRYNSDQGASNSQWNSIRTYVQRPIPSLRSQVTLGESFTPGNLFSSMGFRGILFQTDDRMLPESQRGYAPTIRGVASTTAKVSVRQSGVQIYQTTVAPGAFVIDDLYPTSFQGDLVVEIQEADGRISSFTVPFSAVPDSMRPGHSNLSIAAGQVRNIGNSNATFADLTYQAGLTNAITANSGIRVSDGYQALLGGTVFASQLGAFGTNAVYSRADMWGKTLDGWRLGTTYSRTFAPTSTTLALAGYRYSTQGYRDLNDVLGIRDAYENNKVWSSNTYQQSNQFVATISQSLGEYGQLYFSGSTSTYRGGRGRDTQYQMAYSHSFKNISYNLSLSRQQTGSTRLGVQSADNVSTGSAQNLVMFSISIPLGAGSRSPILSSGVSHATGSNGNTSYQTALAGTLGEDQSLSYTVNGAFDSGGTGGSFGSSVTKQMSRATVGGNFSQGRNYTQGGASVRGAAVLHSGGVTFGPYLGDTFGLVEADGVKGAEVINGMGAKINNSGYAIVPSLVPYRFNDISLDAKGIENASAELTENQQRIAPYAGSVVKVQFKTLEGYALLIKLLGAQPGGLPLGSNVYDSNNTVVGLVGQGNQIYVRAPGKEGKLHVKWGESASEQCTLSYDLRSQDMTQSLYRLELPCNGH
ncbi:MULTISPECIES: fimbria/pilus outer membrane usher protein [unclassified Serratia (in: enterobacteria)]|uniref:fimbria/pilus outer membrane usher protein n=1 Tax=unclassified Serratia (in: enterobacteria) TaxID=2647522 RepID=UPI000503D480|nr:MULTISPECIES: fimbria/pilus outer membrane usher protein [unclassified Serratia (in: enterobacteria)]KFK96598.1 fimbrial assembly protein [Serratia sp. Ag2]KFK99782.1 fimbrial assembly protein [Serratia sp. Ag1]